MAWVKGGPCPWGVRGFRRLSVDTLVPIAVSAGCVAGIHRDVVLFGLKWGGEIRGYLQEN